MVFWTEKGLEDDVSVECEKKISRLYAIALPVDFTI